MLIKKKKKKSANRSFLSTVCSTEDKKHARSLRKSALDGKEVWYARYMFISSSVCIKVLALLFPQIVIKNRSQVVSTV